MSDLLGFLHGSCQEVTDWQRLGFGRYCLGLPAYCMPCNYVFAIYDSYDERIFIVDCTVDWFRLGTDDTMSVCSVGEDSVQCPDGCCRGTQQKPGDSFFRRRWLMCVDSII